MPLFTYKAKDTDGKEYEGEATVTDRFELYTRVKKEGGEIISVTERNIRGGFDMDKINLLLGRVKQGEKIVFVRNLSSMLSAGLALTRALGIIERQTKNPKLKDVVNTLIKDVRAGNSFYVALNKFPKIFSPLLVSMVKAGEEGGSLPNALKIVGEQMEKNHTLQKKVRGAMIYPSIIIVALILIGVLMMMFIVPTLQGTFEELEIELPASTQFIINMSTFLVTNTFAAFLSFFGVVFAFIYGLRTKTGKRTLEFVFLRMPVIGDLVREINSARTTRTLAALLSSGVEVVQAFTITHDVLQNSYYKEVLAEASEKIQKGSTFAEIFEGKEHLYPILVSEFIAVGEETGTLPQMLIEVAQFYEKEVEQKTKDMSTIIEPVLMIIVGAAVGFFAISMISPIYSINSGI